MEPDIVQTSKDFALLLRKYRNTLLVTYKDEKVIPPEICAIVSEDLSRLVKMIIPHYQQKLSEVIVAAEQPTPHSVSMLLTGADIIEKGTNSKTEVKVSVCSSHVNFNWNLPTKRLDETDSSYMNRVRDSIHDKTAYGGAILRVEDQLGNVMVQFHLSYAFLMEYFSRLRINAKGKHNMRSALCDVCNKFHRLEKLLHWSQVLDREKQAYKVDWDSVFTVEPKCSK